MKEEWKYLITPAFVARMASGKLEIRRLDNDEWETNTDISMHESVIKNGTIASEKEANEAHQIFKKTLI